MAGPTIKFNMSEFQRAAKKLGANADQVPFALAGALNDSVEAARKELVEDVWPSSIDSRNKSFMKAALTTKGQRATKKRLRVAIVESDTIGGRGNLRLHADGGTRKPLRSRIAVPSSDVDRTRTGKGVRKRYRAMLDKSNKTSFRLGDTIYERTGKYRRLGKKAKGAVSRGKGKRTNDGRHRKVVFTLKSRTNIKKDVPFRERFSTIMRNGMRKNFAKRIDQAMKTRR